MLLMVVKPNEWDEKKPKDFERLKLCGVRVR